MKRVIEKERREPVAAGGNAAPVRILVVDDDAVFRQEFKDYFWEYGVADSPNGEEALGILKKANEIDLVILDVKMAGMDGIEVLERIKTIAPEIKVIMLTGYGSKDVAVDALRGRADDYLEKSFMNESIRDAITKHLEAKDKSGYAPGMEGKIARVKDFVQKNSQKKITLKDAASLVNLSPKYLSRIFAGNVKTGFHEYASCLKMDKAKGILKQTSTTVEQTAIQLGYQNPESFIRQFKKVTGLTPTEFRTRERKKRGRARVSR